MEIWNITRRADGAGFSTGSTWGWGDNRSLARRTAGTGFGTGFITRRAVGKGF
jgi:hypothetical protein